MATRKRQYAIPMELVYKLKRVQKSILEEPKRMNMESWGYKVSKDLPFAPACGTIGCIAGWLSINEDQKKNLNLSNLQFQRLIYNAESYWYRQFPKLYLPALFFPDNWPYPYLDRLNRYPKGTKKYAQVVVSRINHFMKTGE